MREGDRLPAIGVGRHLCDDLRGDIAGSGEGMRLFDHRSGDDRTVLEHIFQVDQLAIGYGAGHISQIVDEEES